MGRCEKLKWNRRKLGMTQKELADKIGVCVSTISKLETDETAWATIHDSTEDAICDILYKFGSWQCDVKGIIDRHVSEKSPKELRRQLKEKRLSLGMSQNDLGKLFNLSDSSISKYELHDSVWENKDSLTVKNLMDFIDGKYDNPNDVEEDKDKDKEASVISSINTSEVMEIIVTKDNSVENTLNDMIDILQDKLAASKTDKKATHVYVAMIGGLCDAYLKEM